VRTLPEFLSAHIKLEVSLPNVTLVNVEEKVEHGVLLVPAEFSRQNSILPPILFAAVPNVVLTNLNRLKVVLVVELSLLLNIGYIEYALANNPDEFVDSA